MEFSRRIPWQATVPNLENQLDRLSRVKDDCGSPVDVLDKSKVVALIQRIFYSYPDRLSKPALFLTQELILLLEWEAESSPIANIDLKKMEARFYVFIANDEVSSKTFDLSEESGLKSFVDFLSDCKQLVPHCPKESFHETLSPYGIALERFADRSPTHPIEDIDERIWAGSLSNFCFPQSPVRVNDFETELLKELV